jgi:phage terminase large subunit-like protein
MTALNFDLLTSSEKRELLALLEERERRASRRRIDRMFPTMGPLRRELYPKHLEFFAAGAEHRERLFLAANRVGKTEGAGGYETALHLTGKYPDWWPGRRFNHAVQWWAAGKTNETVRDIVQTKLLGRVAWEGAGKGFEGTGLVPGDDIGAVGWKSGVPDLADTVKVKHVSGGWSVLGLKSYQQGRGSFEGTEQDGIWLDEEPPMDVYVECLVRTMTTNGMVLLTFTPLEGMSDVVLAYLEPDRQAL